MKHYALLLLVIAAFAACKNKDAKSAKAALKDTANYTTIQWLDSVVNIGDIKPGEKKNIEFRFRNTGSNPLFIADAKPGCGCTVADYPKEGIAPGKEGVIKAEYSAAPSGFGEVSKHIEVTANTQGKQTTSILFHGKILGPDDLKEEQHYNRDSAKRERANKVLQVNKQ